MTKRILATGLLAWLMALLLPSAAWSSPQPPPRIRTVVLVLAPYLTWDDVISGYMPTTQSLAFDSAVGNMNVRSLLPDAGQPRVEAGALMLSAGTWARYDPAAGAAEDFSGGAVVVPGIGVLNRANAGEDAEIRLGALGEAIERAGGVTAAIGNGDGPSPSRPAAFVAMDAGGRVRLGDVSTGLTRIETRSPAPLGLMSNAPALLSELRSVLRGRQAASGPALVVLDPGDLARAHAALGGKPEGLERLDRVGALKQLDSILATAGGDMPRDALLIVAAPVAAESAGTPSGWGPLIISGDGWTGELTSSSTHRGGLVTSADLSATMLGLLGVPRPAGFMGGSISGAGGRSNPSDRIADLRQIDATTRAVDASRGRVIDGFILATVLLMLAAVAAVLIQRVPIPVVQVVQLAIILIVAVPAANMLMFLPLRRPPTAGAAVGLFLATALGFWVIDVVSHHVSALPRSLVWAAILTTITTLVDQWLGTPLSFDAFLGYSPLVGARYYGLGNEGAALLVGATILSLTLLFDQYRTRDWAPFARRFLFPLAGVVCVVTAAAPFLGANVGVAVWGTLAFALTWASMAGIRNGAKTVLVIAVVVVLLIGAFAAIDLARPAAEQTHLARSLLSAARGGPGELATIVARKAATNVALLIGTNWTVLFLVMVGSLIAVRVRPSDAFREILAEYPHFAAGLTACIVAGVVAYFTEDSGIVVPSLLLLFPAVGALYLMLSRRIAEAER